MALVKKRGMGRTPHPGQTVRRQRKWTGRFSRRRRGMSGDEL